MAGRFTPLSDRLHSFMNQYNTPLEAVDGLPPHAPKLPSISSVRARLLAADGILQSKGHKNLLGSQTAGRSCPGRKKRLNGPIPVFSSAPRLPIPAPGVDIDLLPTTPPHEAVVFRTRRGGSRFPLPKNPETRVGDDTLAGSSPFSVSRSLDSVSISSQRTPSSTSSTRRSLLSAEVSEWRSSTSVGASQMSPDARMTQRFLPDVLTPICSSLCEVPES